MGTRFGGDFQKHSVIIINKQDISTIIDLNFNLNGIQYFLN